MSLINIINDVILLKVNGAQHFFWFSYISKWSFNRRHRFFDQLILSHHKVIVVLTHQLHERRECILWKTKPNSSHFRYNLSVTSMHNQITHITNNIIKKQSIKWLTSIAAIILYPQESIVCFHSGKPSGITGSALSSYRKQLTKVLVQNKNTISIYKDC